ncbi:hypothetical protein DXG03_000802 [Asterophora parasitica]|uniref:Uncharacterized protein n=1 Tax=Asterophora parasitica TaxID=117018 RepID=A0A9P7GAZ0_9AGAR|nr:hypothetical protein DXG03_000802 [Asterophora parasitica]
MTFSSGCDINTGQSEISADTPIRAMASGASTAHSVHLTKVASAGVSLGHEDPPNMSFRDPSHSSQVQSLLTVSPESHSVFGVDTQPRKKDDISPIDCLFCEHVATIPAGAMAEIDSVCQHNKTLVATLGKLGIHTDNHLALLRQNLSGAVNFLETVPMEMLGSFPLYRKYLESLLRLEPTIDQNVHTFRYPSKELEKDLLDGSYSRSPLLRMVNFPDDEICLALVDKINKETHGSEDTLTTFAEMVEKISECFPFLNKYEKRWPILIHLQWRFARSQYERHGAKLCTPAENECPAGRAESMWRAPSQSNQQAPPWSGCPVHPRVDWHAAPSKLQDLLMKLHMEELMPLFLEAQVRSDEEFEMLRHMDEKGRISVFELLDLPHVKLFQRWMLKIALADCNMRDPSLY